MKFQEIARLCKRKKRVLIFDETHDDGTISQYISDGIGVYPMGELPYMDEKGILRVFDVSEDSTCKWFAEHLKLPHFVNTQDVCNDDIPATQLNVSIVSGNATYVPLQLPEGIVWINADALRPIDTQYQLFKRGEAIVAKAGFLFLASIHPVQLPTNAEDALRSICDSLYEE